MNWTYDVDGYLFTEEKMYLSNLNLNDFQIID